MDRPVEPDPQTGFTLIELMVVVAILALLTTTLTLSVNRPQSTDLTDARRFEAVHAQLRNQAIMSGQILGLRMDGAGFQRLRWQAEWQALGDVAAWRRTVQVMEPLDLRSPVQFAPSGQASAVHLRFETGSGTQICRGDGWAELTCSAG